MCWRLGKDIYSSISPSAPHAMHFRWKQVRAYAGRPPKQAAAAVADLTRRLIDSSVTGSARSTIDLCRDNITARNDGINSIYAPFNLAMHAFVYVVRRYCARFVRLSVRLSVRLPVVVWRKTMRTARQHSRLAAEAADVLMPAIILGWL
jgi:hypothetical protein